MRYTTHAIELVGGAVVCESCDVAASPRSRLRGLLGRETLASHEGLLLRGCSAVHTWFMRFPIDVVFLDGDFHVVAVAEAVPPWHSMARRRARHVLELAAGEAARRGIRVGDRVTIRDHPRAFVSEDALGVPAT